MKCQSNIKGEITDEFDANKIDEKALIRNRYQSNSQHAQDIKRERNTHTMDGIIKYNNKDKRKSKRFDLA